jgi:DNA damage-binding protein 1
MNVWYIHKERQPYIVTCSGGRNTGSLNVVRHGADFEELAVVDGISDVTNIWPIRNLFMDRYASHSEPPNANYFV